MSPSRRACTVLAGATLVAVALAAAAEVLHARDAKGKAARDWERRSAQAERVRRASKALELRMEREQAHARMPDTLYASTPDPSPPHPFLLDAGTEPAPTPSAAGVPARSATRLGYRLGLFPSASRWREERGYQGFVRVVNRSGAAGEVRIDAWDDAGDASRSGDARHRRERDEALQLRGPGGGQREDKGLSRAPSGAGEGDWRLALASHARHRGAGLHPHRGTGS